LTFSANAEKDTRPNPSTFLPGGKSLLNPEHLASLIFVRSISPLRGDALSNLLLYNLAFIIPLVLVFGLFYLGVTQRRFAFFLRKRGVLIKLITSAFFFLLGGIMLSTIF
jgi:hypothetical protein